VSKKNQSTAVRPRITTTIERRYLSDIIARKKPIEYRENKPYWRRKLAAVSCPFELRLINGMRPFAPEVTVLIRRVTESKRDGEFRLHIARVLGWKNWDSKARVPKARSSQ
jgi:hypothetical protein